MTSAQSQTQNYQYFEELEKDLKVSKWGTTGPITEDSNTAPADIHCHWEAHVMVLKLALTKHKAHILKQVK